MNYLEFKVSLEPSQVIDRLHSDSKLNSYLVFEDNYKSIKESNYEIHILVFERYFWRINSTASLTVTIDNLSGDTIVKCISSGSGDGILNINWGAGEKFISLVKGLLESNIIEMIKES